MELRSTMPAALNPGVVNNNEREGRDVTKPGKIDNTTEQVREDPLMALSEAHFRGTSGMIEAQEARGQEQVVAAAQGDEALIATNLHSPREQFEAVGFEFLGPVEGDDLFQRVRLPDGWAVEGTGHSMWTKIRDADGFERCAQFYKAAFYDRGAHIGLTRIPTTVAQDEACERLREALEAADGDRWRYPTESKAEPDHDTGPILVTFLRYAQTDDGGKDYLQCDAERRYFVEPDGTSRELLALEHEPPIRAEW